MADDAKTSIAKAAESIKSSIEGSSTSAISKHLADYKKSALQHVDEEGKVGYNAGDIYNIQSLEKELADAQKKERQLSADVGAGTAFGEAILGDGLGRLDENVNLGRVTTDTSLGRATEDVKLQTLRDSDIMGIEERFKEASKGMDSAEMLARKEQAMQGISQDVQTKSRSLASQLSRFGVKGGAAGEQLASIQIEGLQQRENLETDLMLQAREAERQGLIDYSNFASQTRQFDINQYTKQEEMKLTQERFNLGQEVTEKQMQLGVEEYNLQQERAELEMKMSTQQFNLSQAAKEKDILLQTGLGFAELGATERGAELSAEASKAAAAAESGCFLPGSEIYMQDGSLKKIEDIKVGEFLLGGGEVVISGACYANSKIYKYGEEFISEYHVLYEDGEIIECHSSKIAELTDMSEKTLVYALDTENHFYLSKGDILSIGFAKVEGSYSPEQDLEILNNDDIFKGILEDIKCEFQSGTLKNKIIDK